MKTVKYTMASRANTSNASSSLSKRVLSLFSIKTSVLQAPAANHKGIPQFYSKQHKAPPYKTYKEYEGKNYYFCFFHKALKLNLTTIIIKNFNEVK